MSVLAVEPGVEHPDSTQTPIVPAVVAIGLPVTWIFSIPLSTLGGCLISGAYFLAIGYLLVNQAIERRPAREAILA